VKPMASYRSLAARRQVPILEQLPSINVNDLQIPRDYKTYIAPNISLRYGFLAGARLSWDAVEFYFPSLHRGQLGRVQTFELKHIKTGFGIRHAFICIGCDRAVITLYHLHGNLACRHCHGAVFASQTLDKRTRPILQISRIQSFLDHKQGLYHRTRERLRQKLGDKIIMAQGSCGTEARSLWK
jgi:hypothetical protein